MFCRKGEIAKLWEPGRGGSVASGTPFHVAEEALGVCKHINLCMTSLGKAQNRGNGGLDKSCLCWLFQICDCCLDLPCFYTKLSSLQAFGLFAPPTPHLGHTLSDANKQGARLTELPLTVEAPAALGYYYEVQTKRPVGSGGRASVPCTPSCQYN